MLRDLAAQVGRVPLVGGRLFGQRGAGDDDGETGAAVEEVPVGVGFTEGGRVRDVDRLDDGLQQGPEFYEGAQTVLAAWSRRKA